MTYYLLTEQATTEQRAEVDRTLSSEDPEMEAQRPVVAGLIAAMGGLTPL